MNARLKAWFEKQRRDPRWAVLAGLAVISVVVMVLTWDRSAPLAAPEPAGFVVSPSGDDVARLAPIKVTFAKSPSEHNGAKLMQLEPAVAGQYAWLSDRTLLFQPDYPGLLRGTAYTVSVAARPDAGLDHDVSQTFTTTGALTVVQAVPSDGDSEVPSNAKIIVQFSRSVAPLTLLSEQKNTPVITFDPPLEGTGEWLNTSLYRFTPKTLPPNTSFHLRIAAGLSSAADGVLKQDYSWSFTTVSPAVASITPDNSTIFAGPHQQVVVTFNQAMDRPSVENSLKIADATGAAVAGAFTWTAANDAVTFTPTGTLAQATQYIVTAPARLKGANGGATAVERTTSFTTAGPPAITSTQPAAGNTKAERYGISFQFSNPMDEDSFDGRVAVTGFTQDEVNQAINSSEQNLYLSLTLKPSSAYTVTLAAGIVDRYGQPLPPKTFSFQTGALPASVSLATPGYGNTGTYSASAEPILYFHATNTPSATFTLYPLTADEAASWYSGQQYRGPNQFQPSQNALRSWTQNVSAGLDEIAIDSTSLSGGGPLPKGDYYVRTSGTYASEMAFAVVDTEIVTKLATDSLLAWIIDHDTGKPLQNVTVHAVGAGITTADLKTDANGLVSYPVPRQANAFGPQSGYLLTVNDGAHRGVSSTSWQQGTAPYQLGIPQDYYTRTYVGQLITDRPIYRPGESVNYKGIIRQDDDASYSVPSANLPLALVIRDAKGTEALRTAFTLNQFGSFAGSLQLPADASTGDYQITIEASDKNQAFPFVAQNSFLVAEFKKPEFQVDVTTGSANYVNGDAIDASARAAFFFGGALTGAPVTWSTIGSPFAMQVKGFETYSFTDYDYYRQAVVKQPVRSTGSATTDANGVASFSIPATLNGNEGAQQFDVSATITDTNAQAVANSTTVTVHPAALYAGVRPTNYIATAGKDAGIDVVSVDTSGAPVPNTAVSVRVYSRKWITTKTQTPDGARRYDSQPEDTLITTLATTTDAKGVGHVVYSPSAVSGGAVDGGTLRITASVTDAKGRTETSASYLWITGAGFASWQVTNDDTIKLIADKDSYKVGDTAQVLVPAPFAGATGLVTVERGKVITQTVQQFATNSETLQIPIVDHDVPNVFVSVVLYRPPTTEDPVPRYKVGYVELPVSTDVRHLNVSITPNTSQAKPGDTVHYDIKVTDSTGKGVKSELSVAVIDKALLSLQDERGPDGLKAFWFERGLGVFTASSLAVSVNRSNDVIAEPPAGGKGGGGLDGDRLRQDFRNTAYWDAQVQTDDNGNASVDVKMPDNLTTWRMDARAISGGTMVGEGQNELLSTRPLLLRPALPRFLRVGDSVQLRTLVTNASGKPSDVTVALAAEGVDVASTASQKQTIAAGQSATFQWEAKVTVPGTAKLTFSASGSGGLSDSVVQTLPVSLDVTPETTATGGIVTDTSQIEAVFLPQYAILKGGTLQVAVQAALAGSMAGELSNLDPLPYEYSERIASRLMATIGVRRADKSAGRSTSAYDARIASDLAALSGQQKVDGGWGWCDTCASDPNITGWVLIALGEGKRDGINVDSTIASRASSYVFTYVNRAADVAHPADPNQKAFLLYGLSLATPGDATSAVSSARALLEQYRSKLANWGRAYLLLAIDTSGSGTSDAAVTQLVNDITAATIPSANGNHWEDARIEGTFMTNTAATALVLEALVHADPQNPLVAQTVRWLMVARGAEQWSTTAERSEAILAISDYSTSTGELAGNFSYRVTLDGGSVLAGAYKPGESARTDKTSVPLTTLSAGKQSIFEFARQANTVGRLYYTLNLKYLTPAKDVEALNRGFAVSHQYTLLGDPSKPITQAKLGDTVRVTVTVVAPADGNYVVVDDLLPAGLEPVDPRLKSTDPALIAKLTSDRQKASALHEGDYYAPWFGWYFDPWQHVDTRDDRVSLYASSLSKGVYEYVYYARATTPGDFFVGPAHVEESYFPDVFGRSDSGRFVVVQ